MINYPKCCGLNIYISTAAAASLSLHLEGASDLVSGLVQLGAIQESRQSHSDTGSQGLLVAQTNLAGVINLSSNAGIITKVILATNSKVCVAGSGCVDGDTGFESGPNLVVDTTTEDLSVVSSDVENHIISGVSKSKVVLDNSRLAGVESSAVAESPWAVSNAGAAVNDGAGGKSHVGGKEKPLVFVLSLQLAGNSTAGGLEGAVQSDLKAGHKLVGDVEAGVQSVVGVPLLGHGNSIIGAFVLGLEVTRDNTAVNGRASTAGEFNAVAGLGLDLQLHQAKVVALAENIAGLLANVRE